MNSTDGIGPIVIVGAGLAGTRTATGLREAGYTGDLILIGAEDCLPYDRPPLSKAVVRGDASDTAFHPRQFYSEQRIDLRLGLVALGVDPSAREIVTNDSARIGFGNLVLATGIEPSRLPMLDGFGNVHTFRTRADADTIVAHAQSGARVLVVGAGFIGCELAAGCRARGVDVTLIDRDEAPLHSVLGREVGARIAEIHRSEGVELLMGTSILGVHGSERVEGVSLSDGTEILCDFVVTGIGSRPELSWLHDSGIDVDNGILCDVDGRTSVPGVWAVGDVSAWSYGSGHTRVEHWSNVGNQVNRLIPALLGGESAPVAPVVQYFWSDQYDVKLQALGHTSAQSDVHTVEGDGRAFVSYYSRNGMLEGVVGANSARKVMTMRRGISGRVPVSDLLA